MSKRQTVKPFAPMRSTPGAAAVATLTADEAIAWRAAVRARQDAVRAAELAAARARVAIGEAAEAEIAMVRGLAARYGFDADGLWALDTEGRVVPATQGGSQ